MSSNSTVLQILLWAVILLHVAAPIVILFDDTSWTRRLLWILIVCSAPILGPLYALLFRHEWREPYSPEQKTADEEP